MKGWGWIAGGIAAALVAAAVVRLRWPLDHVFITSPFGEMRPTGPHNGVDLRASIGTPVLAPGPGVVAETGTNDRSGRYLVMMLDNGLRAGFAHLSEWVAMDGDRVAPGDVLALTGATGNATAPHLHYTLRRGDTWLDPSDFSA